MLLNKKQENTLFLIVIAAKELLETIEWRNSEFLAGEAGCFDQSETNAVDNLRKAVDAIKNFEDE